MKSLVRPYGLVAEVGKSSVTGTDAGSPYTCHARCARIGAEVGCGQWVATAAWRGTHRAHADKQGGIVRAACGLRSSQEGADFPQVCLRRPQTSMWPEQTVWGLSCAARAKHVEVSRACVAQCARRSDRALAYGPCVHVHIEDT